MSTVARFGQFFKQRRMALGLTLREFCRRNGFDPGNISRLERGLLSPPKSREVLESYAKSLKLQPDSNAWHTFFDLAAAETGSIPPQMLANQALVEKLPQVFRRLRGQRRRYRTWTKAINLEAWAASYDSRYTLPQLVRRLVHATVDSPIRIDFPAGEGVDRPGWDGIVETPNGNAYVPPGISGWELSTNKEPLKKAEEDFKNRLKDSRGLDTHQISFIFVTPRKITKDRWCAEKNELGVWKEVRAYDSTNLEEWLETAPAVDAWFARLIGQRPEGVTDIDDHWANLTALTHPSLKPEVFLTSREQEIEVLTKWLAGPPGDLAFEARSPVEVLDFVSAYLASLDETQRDAIAARILIVKELEAWSALAAESNRLVLIPQPALAVEAEMVAEAVRHGHHVLLCSHRFATERADKHKLPPPYRYDLEKALISSGFNAEEASRRAREAGGSLTVLKRCLARFASTRQPEWSRPSEASRLVPILLAGGWDDNCAADRAVIEKLAGRAYDEVLAVAHRWLHEEDPPVMRVLTRWSLASREDSWRLLAPYTLQQLDTFEEVAIEVLGEDDPRYELPPHERVYAAIHKKLPKHSPQLRTGLAETVALLGAKADVGLISDTVTPPARRAERVVRKLLPDNTSWQRWASLSDYLPLLAEACPDAFLNAIESDLRRSRPALLRLFQQEVSLLFVSSPHTGLLWALETLAWEPSSLSRVSLILAQLAQNDPGVQLAHRPQNVLREIFLPWFPHTTASIEQRIRILDHLTNKYPDTAWQLLLSILPRAPDFSTPGYRPTFRDWALNWSRGVATAEYWQQIEACAERLLKLVGDNIERWEQLLESFEHLPQAAQQRGLEMLKTFATRSLDIDMWRRIADTLRRKVQKHRYFSSANRALPSEVVDALEMLQRQFEPQELVAQYAWLFGYYLRLPQNLQELSREEQVFQARREALEHILTTEGLPKILALAKVVEAPYTVGKVLGEAKLLADEHDILPSLLTTEQWEIATFAKGFVQGRFAKSSWEWVEQLPLAEWSVEQVSIFSQELPCERRTWALVAQFGNDVSTHYWQHTKAFPRSLSVQEVEYAVAMLLQHHRPWQAIRVLGMALHNGCSLRSSFLMEALEDGLKYQRGKHATEEGANIVWYDIQEIVQCLQSDSEVDTQRLAALEWGYLPLLDGHDVSPKALYTWLQQDPQCFVELLSLIFRSRKESAEAVAPPSEEQQTHAQNAYRVLRSWETVPGAREDGTVDDQKLMEWVTTARALCEETGRLEVCDISIGEVLAHALPESDGSWPCIPVRDVIEEIDSEELVRGFEVRIFNKRGAYSKSLTEGGKQERALAQQYAAYADACAIEWPRTAATLKRVAQRYEDDARREDEEAQKRF